MDEEKNNSKQIYIAIIVAIVLIAAGGYFVLGGNTESIKSAVYHQPDSKDTITLYKSEGAWKVYYDSEFDVYCWEYSGTAGGCKTSAELKITRR